MSDTVKDVERLAAILKKRQSGMTDPRMILKAPELKQLVVAIKEQPKSERAAYGKAVNELKRELSKRASDLDNKPKELASIDVTAPFDTGVARLDQPELLTADQGTVHPVTRELIEDIFIRMGFDVERSRLIDDDYHMFGSLNFPKDHPARDDYDTFMTQEDLILPAHTSTMQNRILKKYRRNLNDDRAIAAVIPGRVFRNEDLDATHEHTFHQVEGVYVGEGVSLADMLGTIGTFLETYFGETLEFKTQPFYFPFVEPGLEYLIKMPKKLQKQAGSQWLEIMGCGMIHPQVLKEGGINPDKFSGFAWGMGVERLVMLKYGIEDVRYFMSGRLDFLRMFKG